jgi:hypothetical protein
MAKEAIEFQRASMNAAQTINSFGIVGQRYTGDRLVEEASSINGGFSVQFERAWGVACTLTIGFKASSERIGKSFYRFIPKVSVVWPSSSMDPNAGQAAVALFQEVVSLACLLQTQLDAEIISTKNLEKE